MNDKTQSIKTNADLATAYALENGLNIVSDMFGKAFVVQREGQQAFRVARLDPKVKGDVALGARDYPSLDVALAYIKERYGIETPTEKLASLPSQDIVRAYCVAHGMKASDHMHSGYLTISRPIQDRNRQWQVAKRVGNTLKPLSEIAVRDRWGALAKVVQLGGPEVTEALTGAMKFPFGDSYSMPPKRDTRDGDQGKAA